MKKFAAVILALGMLLFPALGQATESPSEVEIIVEEAGSEEEENLTPEESEAESQDPEEDLGNEEEDEDEQSDSGEKVLTPDSPFYFIKRFIENIRVVLTFDEENKEALLAEMAEERAKELEALNQKFSEGELSEKEFNLLEKALDDLIDYTEKLVDAVAALEPATEDDEDEDGLDDEGTEEGDEEALEDDDKVNKEDFNDKYEWRIAHLQAIADRAPASAQKGLNRAMENAARQRERAIARGKITPAEEPKDDEEAPGDEEESAVEEDGLAGEPEEGIQETEYEATFNLTNEDEGIEEAKEFEKKSKDKSKPQKAAPGQNKVQNNGPPMEVPGRANGLKNR